MSDEELQMLVASTAQKIRMLGGYDVSKVNLLVDSRSRQIIHLQRQSNALHRRMDDTMSEIRNLRVDTRELQIENNRILYNLEQRIAIDK
ncbi:hypothetical protein [Scytonema millei]|uniref:Hemagglutinin n=1 Tax=Scytonema millei VB511283 TaxID=1245923 RepID=A0A9X5I699_9CYAN|nr:hypothetical protein [Scytonema millei]NHC36901.1 hemagglutinin [Scytonema millei VB511283]